jgi:nondiscriminating glutamyl-tRNA synthetase
MSVLHLDKYSRATACRVSARAFGRRALSANMAPVTPTPIRTRFAPSPTGYLHLGNARTALFNFLLAAGGGAFVLRSEDTDAERSDDALLAAVCEDLHWLGLEWQEGPDRGGAYGPYRQSERAEIYADYFLRLEAAERAYPCFCTPAELAIARRVQQAAGQPPRYAGTCRGLDAEARADRLARGDTATLRFAVDGAREVDFNDIVHGPRHFAASDLGDFVIRRADGSAAFLFSNALDDALMAITHVLRGEDHLSNTPRQLLVLEALGFPPPRYGHLPLVLGEDGTPLSKRTGSASVRAVRAEGVLSEALCNHLARLGHAMASGVLMSVAELAAAFDVERLGRAPARHDPAQLGHWQREAVHRATAERLWRWMDNADLDALVPVAQRIAFVKTVQPNLDVPSDGVAWAQRLYAEPAPYSDDARAAIKDAGAEFFAAALAALPGVSSFKELAAALASATARKGRALYQPLRAALTAATDGPELAQVYLLLGERVEVRLQAARAQAE